MKLLLSFLLAAMTLGFPWARLVQDKAFILPIIDLNNQVQRQVVVDRQRNLSRSSNHTAAVESKIAKPAPQGASGEPVSDPTV